MNLIGATILAVLLLGVLSGSRRNALLSLMAGVLFLTQAQSIEIAGFNIFAIRFLELAGFIRVITRREFSFRQLNIIDRTLLLLYVYVTVVFLLRSTEGQAYQIGLAVDAFLSYFTFRGLVQEMEDLRTFLRTFIYLIGPYAVLVLVGSFTVHNPFTILGGTAADVWMRNGRPRFLASFRQPDTLGMFAASFLPLYIGLSCIVNERRRALLGVCCCLGIAWAANSGGTAAGAMMGLLGWGFWRIRTEMHKVRWAIVAGLAGLALVMKAPIWYIFARVSTITGGDGWHRSHLINEAYKSLNQWWLAGMPIQMTSNWFSYHLGNHDQADITNQFISFGLAAGVAAIAMFILLLKRAFSNLGKALASVRSATTESRDNEFLLWGLGVMLVVHITDWFGITYFDQMYMVWFMQFAAIASVTTRFLAVELPDTSSSIEVASSRDECASLSAIHS